MKILLTGGAGFIGSQIADAYIESGHNVSIIDNLSTGRKENINPKAKFFEIDITDKSIIQLLNDEKFDVVNHHAAQIDVRKSVADPIYDAKVNILGTINILESCAKTEVKKIIFASTGGAVYGEQKYFPADENHPVNPLSPYGITKLSIEKYLHFYKAEYGLEYSILRYANVYGPRQNPFGEAGVVAIFVNKLLKGEQPIINGDGNQTRDYTFSGDVVKANLLVLSEPSSDIYNIGTGVETNVNELFRVLNDLTDGNAEEKHGPTAKGEQVRSVISSGKIIKKLNWKPTTSLVDGLKITLDYYKNLK
ncbi:MAG: NAD-dependent epimerase/dehydratase family protein [Ignavibacteria bacterium]|nr:NAD-dependent epimerase/dehydratase family protein [Ignavibacteria bacterium]MBT8383065.1 NAD-dependent epimerase/dehydratase family protein [Ignavibacteria bacterium]MBT8392396.1 NAD-dependent epimerase/dehydratase family protein [Ignavibacteria bacterium]NNJ52659.1 NAD-dependent epimerase/dehydratase family protein [Ignavibacteriaceae bacterium]NNL22180.1 NAD-dependent epimerase/dehydratase family protein [Ignavibacteriaceae bacterium]